MKSSKLTGLQKIWLSRASHIIRSSVPCQLRWTQSLQEDPQFTSSPNGKSLPSGVLLCLWVAAPALWWVLLWSCDLLQMTCWKGASVLLCYCWTLKPTKRVWRDSDPQLLLPCQPLGVAVTESTGEAFCAADIKLNMAFNLCSWLSRINVWTCQFSVASLLCATSHSAYSLFDAVGKLFNFPEPRFPRLQNRCWHTFCIVLKLNRESARIHLSCYLIWSRCSVVTVVKPDHPQRTG